MNLKCKNLLITGGAGFIGSHFIRLFLNRFGNVNIINLDNLTYASDINNYSEFEKNSNYKFIKGDICDYNLVLKIFDIYEIDGVINFAAESHVDKSIKSPDLFVKTNINGTHNLLKISYDKWMIKPFKKKKKFVDARFHQVSTDEVYGSIISGSFSEDSKYLPNSPYSASKAAADMLVRSYNITYGLNTTISISSNNYGKGQNIEKFIPTVVNSIKNNKNIHVYGDGKNIRDWIFVEDNCNAIILIFVKGKSGDVYNVGGGTELNNLQLIDILFDIISKKYNVVKKIKFVKDRYGHDRRYSLNTKKIRDEIGWINETDFKKNLEKIIFDL